MPKSKSKSKPQAESKPKKRVIRKRIPQIHLSSTQSEGQQSQNAKSLKQKKIRSFQTRRSQAIEIMSGKNNPSKFLYRDNQINDINKCLDQFMNEQKAINRFLMVTGSPGGGKTLSINYILRHRKQKVIKLNANQLKSFKDIQEKIYEELLGKKGGRQMSSIQIIRELQKQSIKKFILYIQEIQILLKTPPDDKTSDFFSIFNKKQLKIALIGTSNSIDTLHKYQERLRIDTAEIKNIVFKPYTMQMVKDIITQKIQTILDETEIKIEFPEKLKVFSAKKIVTEKKGDLRFALQFLKNLISELLYHSYDNEKQEQEITLDLIRKIFAKMNQEKDTLIASIPFTQQVLILALHAYVKRTDAMFATQPELITDLKWICDSIKVPYKPEMMQGLEELQQYNFISRKSKNNQTRILLKLALTQIQASFGEHPIFKRFFED